MGILRNLCKLGLTSAVFFSLASATLYGQAPENRGRVPVVSDWTQRHLLYPEPRDKKIQERLRAEPRWSHAWYMRHPDAWWPTYRPNFRSHRRIAERDWSLALGSTAFEPIFDFNFSLQGESGYGNLNVTDEATNSQSVVVQGDGTFTATSGTLTVNGPNDIGTYSLVPGGPTLTTQGGIGFDNQIFPVYPNLNPSVDRYGLLFTNAGFNINLTGPVASVYVFYDPTNTFDGPSFNLNVDPGGGDTSPSKFVFDVNATPSCTNDYVTTGLPAIPTSGQANIVGVNNLYSSPSGGYCPGTAPKVKFAYASGTGQVPAGVVISQFGTQLAYIENLPTGSAYFHVLTLGTTGNNGSSATAPAVPGTGNNAVDRKVLLSPDSGFTLQSSTTMPFVVYTSADSADVAYVTTYTTGNGVGSASGYVYKISNVFNGSTPTIAWYTQVTGMPSTPVYDASSNKIFFTDSNGRINYITDNGGSGSVTYGTQQAKGTTSENAPVVDSTNQMVYASFNSNGTNAIVVQTPTTLASYVKVPVGTAGTGGFTGPYGVDFNNAFYAGTGTPMMFVAGNGSTSTPVPTLYGVGFTGKILNTTAAASTPLATGVGDSSEVTEFYNVSQSKDYIFVGVSDNCIATTQGGTAGCILSLNVTGGFPTVGTGSTALAAPGGTTAIVVDNDSNLGQAASVYYSTKTGATLVKATQAGLQ